MKISRLIYVLISVLVAGFLFFYLWKNPAQVRSLDPEHSVSYRTSQTELIKNNQNQINPKPNTNIIQNFLKLFE